MAAAVRVGLVMMFLFYPLTPAVQSETPHQQTSEGWGRRRRRTGDDKETPLPSCAWSREKWGVKYIREKECNDMQDLLANLIENNKWREFVLYVGGSIATFFFLITLSCIAGTRIKPRPPLYWKNRPLNWFSDGYSEEVDVTAQYKDAVQRLLDITTKREYMGLGRDGAWATHKSFKVVQVTRIENGAQWSKFCRVRRSIPTVKQQLAMMDTNWMTYCAGKLAELARSLEQGRFCGFRPEGERDPKVKHFIDNLWLDSQRNEQLLFHGSPGVGARDASTGRVQFESADTAPVSVIKKVGFDDRLGNVKGMYGSGTYFADMASKADQYAGKYNSSGHPNGSVGEIAKMFLARVILGCPYFTDQSLEQLRRPPCIMGHFDVNLCWNMEVAIGRPWHEKGVAFELCDHSRFDSVIGDFTIDGQKKLYQEYIVYDQQAYPEFCVTYERTQ